MILKLWQVSVEPFDELQGVSWDWLRMGGAIIKPPL